MEGSMPTVVWCVRGTDRNTTSRRDVWCGVPKAFSRRSPDWALFTRGSRRLFRSGAAEWSNVKGLFTSSRAKADLSAFEHGLQILNELLVALRDHRTHHAAHDFRHALRIHLYRSSEPGRGAGRLGRV